MRTQFSKLALSAALALAMAFTLSCSGGGDNGNPADNSGNNSNNGGTNRDSRLVNASGEAWLSGNSCELASGGFIFKSDGDLIWLKHYDDGHWDVTGTTTWRTDGNKIIGMLKCCSVGQYPYEISNSSLILTDGDDSVPFKKCGVNVGG